MPIEVISIFATIGTISLLLFLCFCIGCGIKQISEWSEAVKRDKERQKKEGK